MAKLTSLPIYSEPLRDELRDRLRRIEGQVRGVAKMVEEQRPCVEVLQQLASVQAALKGVTRQALRNYLERCASEAIRQGDPRVHDELLDTIYKFIK